MLSIALAVSCQPATDPQGSPVRTSEAAPELAASNHALSFSHSYVRVRDHGDLDLGTTWTLEAWVFPRAAGNGIDQDLISKWDGVTDAAYILQIDRTGVLRLVTNDGNTQSILLSYTSLVNKVWQHVAVTFNNGAVKLYLNGVLNRVFSGAVTPLNSTQPLAFGREGTFSGGTLNGKLDEIRIWKVVRIAAQVANWRSHRLTGTETGLVGYWRFDEGTGQVAVDATGRGHNGRLGTTTSVDSWDPVWTMAGAPVH